MINLDRSSSNEETLPLLSPTTRIICRVHRDRQFHICLIAVDDARWLRVVDTFVDLKSECFLDPDPGIVCTEIKFKSE